MLSDLTISVVVIAVFLCVGIQYMRLAEPRGFWSWKVTPHLRLGPALFILLAALTAYLAYWEPLSFDSQFGPEVDSRVGWIVEAFAPFTLGIALWGVFAYLRLWRIQFQSRSIGGWLLLGVLAFPLGAAFYTGAILAVPAIFSLPEFVKELLP